MQRPGLFFMVLALAITLVGCGASGAPASYPSSAPGMPAMEAGGGAPAPAAMQEPAPQTQRSPGKSYGAQPVSPSGAKVPPASAPHSATMLIYTANLSLAVFHVEAGLDAVTRIGQEAGGYLSARQDTAVTIRVPRDRFDDTIARIEALGNVLHRDIRARDVTDEYVDLEARLKSSYAMRERLQELLAKAAVKEALDIEAQLGRVTEEIERMEGKLKLMRDEIAFSTITASFAPVAEQPVHDNALLPFSWLQTLGLSSLLGVHP